MQLSRKKTCKNCMLIDAKGCGIGLRTETVNGALVPMEDCFKPSTSRQESNYRLNNMAYHMAVRRA